AKLKTLHETVVRNRLEQLRKRQRDEAFQAQSELLAAATTRNKTFGGDIHADAAKDVEEPAVKEQDDTEPYERGMSPELIDLGKLPYDERQVEILDIVEDMAQLFTKRRAITSTLFVPKASKPEVVVTEGVVADTGGSSAADIESEALYRAEAEKNMDEEEELYNLEELIVNPTTYTWEDKYRPRKPRYFNRIHTGYEWNKYNQTHYDTDNPPPKVVQGYKFNIFYPDLIDKGKAPTYKIVKEPGNEDTVLLHFMAGPPYEDIAFRVVNREWEYSHKRRNHWPFLSLISAHLIRILRTSMTSWNLPPWDQQTFSFGWTPYVHTMQQCSNLKILFDTDLGSPALHANPPPAPPYTVIVYTSGYQPLTLAVGNIGKKGTYSWIVNLPLGPMYMLAMKDSAGYTGGSALTLITDSQCGNVDYVVNNGTSPFQVEIIPEVRQQKTLHFETNRFGFVLDLPAGLSFFVAITDANGNSAVDGILIVGTSNDNTCLNAAATVSVGVATSIYTGSGSVLPMTTSTTSGYSSTTSQQSSTTDRPHISNGSKATSAKVPIIVSVVAGVTVIFVLSILYCIYRRQRLHPDRWAKYNNINTILLPMIHTLVGTHFHINIRRPRFPKYKLPSHTYTLQSIIYQDIYDSIGPQLESGSVPLYDPLFSKYRVGIN
ncbi:unnamed protein product, partial [Rhizoctonia solani]